MPVYFLPSNPRTWRRAARLAISYAKSSSSPNDHLRRGGTVESLPVSFSHAERRQLEPGERFPLVYYCGVGSEGDGAGLNAVDLARRGWKALLAQTKQWLDKRARPAPTEQARARINRNMFFSLFLAAGRTIDTEDLVLVTSRSPRYYVAAAHWSRDSLLWAFPAAWMADPQAARQRLLAAFRLYTRKVGLLPCTSTAPS